MLGLGTLARVAREVRRDVEAARERDPAARGVGQAEIIAAWPGVPALLSHRVAHALHEARVPLAPRRLASATRSVTGIEIHPAARIGDDFFIDHGMGVVIGETAEVGDGCTIYQGVTLGGTSLYRGEKRHPTLGDGVVVGAGAKVLGGFLVGAGARIGSNAVVVKSVPAGATVVGIPGKIVEDPRTNAERFSAYAVVQDHDDPQSKAIQQLVEHSQELERTVENLKDRLARLEALEAAEKDKNLRAVK
jgi:serine O-acetyltransferase